MDNLPEDDPFNYLKMPITEDNDYNLFADIINDPIDIPKTNNIPPISIKEFPSLDFSKPPIPDIKPNIGITNVEDIMNTTTFVSLNFLQTSLISKIGTCRFIITQPNINNTTKTVVNSYINDLNGYLQMITFIINEYTKERILYNNCVPSVPSVPTFPTSKKRKK